MCCSSDRLLPHEYLKWINYGKGNLSRCEINETCLVLRNVNRDDLKTFTCLAEGGRATTQAVFEILCKYLGENMHGYCTFFIPLCDICNASKHFSA